MIPPEEGGAERTGMSEEKKDHILLVDDERHLLVSLRDYLIHENFMVTTADSGEQALKTIEMFQPDLIVLDISMPGMGGMGFLKRITGPNGKPRFPVLVLTARSMLMDFFKTVEVDGFIAKPCDEAEFVGMIRSILARRRSLSEMKSRSRKKVLLAEDDAQFSARVKRLFENSGYDVEVVPGGPELLEMAAGTKPDIILAKEMLPRMNGSAAAALLEMMPSTSALPVVLYDETGDAHQLSQKTARTRCVRRCLGRSDAESLLAAVSAVVAEA